MALEISVNHPQLPKGEEIEIPGVGVVPNGGSLVVSKEQEEEYFAKTGNKLKDSLGKIFKSKAAKESDAKDDEEGGDV